MQAKKVKMEHISDLDIQQLIPQREPMVMISGLLEASDRSVTTCFHIKEGNIFLNEDVFQENGLIENIAQSAAAMNGYHALIAGEAVKKGYIGGIKNLEVHALPEKGDQLTTLITETHNVMDASIILGEVRRDGQLLAKCEMKIFIQAS